MKRKYKKSLLMPLILFVYTTVMAIYFLPRNTEVGVAEKWLTLAGSYVIILLLWYVLRKKEQLEDKRRRELEDMKRTDREERERGGRVASWPDGGSFCWPSTPVWAAVNSIRAPKTVRITPASAHWSFPALRREALAWMKEQCSETAGDSCFSVAGHRRHGTEQDVAGTEVGAQ